MRRRARELGLTVERLPKGGKGSHTIWVVRDARGAEVGRVGLTDHAGQQSQIVTRSNEQALERAFGKGWLDR